MIAINVILPSAVTRRWHKVLVDRIVESGHDVRVVVAQSAGRRDRILSGILSLEHMFVASADTALVTRIEAFERSAAFRSCDLVIDFSRSNERWEESGPTLTVLFEGQPDLLAAAQVLCRGAVPVVDLHLDGKQVAHAAPMAASRVFISRGLDDVLARVITLISNFVDRYEPTVSRSTLCGTDSATLKNTSTAATLASSYLFSALPRLARRIVYRLRYYGGHWRVGYRFIDGPGVVETGSLAGTPWTILPDSGDRFYADPFPFEWQGRHFIFVEELVHSQAKGVISVSECGPDGCFSVPRKVLEEPFHLSYPQIFARDGDIWMIPEMAGGKKLSLYRAAQFPDRWVEQSVLVADREIFDATLLGHNGLQWLFATERDGAGDASDTMVVFFAESMEGPWQPHPMNPVLIDKAGARPGGGFANVGDRIVLPVQDGTECYGGGLGLAQLIRLDPERVELSKPVPINTNGYWPYPRIHTLNRHGRLETIDGLAQVAKRKAR